MVEYEFFDNKRYMLKGIYRNKEEALKVKEEYKNKPNKYYTRIIKTTEKGWPVYKLYIRGKEWNSIGF